MTEEQFQKMMDKLEEINQNIALITAKESGKDKFNLGNLFTQLSDINDKTTDVELALHSVKAAVENLDQ